VCKVLTWALASGLVPAVGNVGRRKEVAPGFTQFVSVFTVMFFGCLIISMASVMMQGRCSWMFAVSSALSHSIPYLLCMECLAAADRWYPWCVQKFLWTFNDQSWSMCTFPQSITDSISDETLNDPRPGYMWRSASSQWNWTDLNHLLNITSISCGSVTNRRSQEPLWPALKLFYLIEVDNPFHSCFVFGMCRVLFMAGEFRFNFVFRSI